MDVSPQINTQGVNVLHPNITAFPLKKMSLMKHVYIDPETDQLS